MLADVSKKFIKLLICLFWGFSGKVLKCFLYHYRQIECLSNSFLVHPFTLRRFCLLKSRSQKQKMAWVRGYEFYQCSSSEFVSDVSLLMLLSSLSSILLLISFVSVLLLQLPEHLHRLCSSLKIGHWHIFPQADFRHSHTIISSTDSGAGMFSIDWIFKRSSLKSHPWPEGDGMSGLASKVCFHT